MRPDLLACSGPVMAAMGATRDRGSSRWRPGPNGWGLTETFCCHSSSKVWASAEGGQSNGQNICEMTTRASERKWCNSTRGQCSFKNRGPSSSRTFIHVLKVLVELPLPCFVVDLLLHHVAPVLDVVSDGHLLHAALRVPQRPPRLLDLATRCDSHTYSIRDGASLKLHPSRLYWVRL